MNTPASCALTPAAIDVISIQSQVAYGYVGNSVAVPAMQAAGLQVAAVPTVVLSNTPHYESLHGGVLPPAWFDGIVSDLDRRGVTGGAKLLLTGFLGDPRQARALATWMAKAQKDFPALQVQVDPVIGDYAQGVFVDPALIEVYRDVLVPLADGLVPNLFELELLTGMPVTTPAAIEAAAVVLQQRTRQGKGWLVVTSTPPLSGAADRIGMLLVTAGGSQALEHVRIDSNPKGTGDLFSALLARQLLKGEPLPAAARAASACVVRMLERTRRLGWQEMAFDPRLIAADPG